MTILTCSKITKDDLDYFVDDSPAKQGWYSPVEHVPIISREEAEKNLPDYFFILAPNYADVIVEKESEFRKKGGQFISISSIENEFINISYIDELSIIPIEDEFWGSKILLF